MLKPVSEMTVDELRVEVEKIEAQRAKRRAYSKLHRKAMTSELRTKLSEYNKQRRVHQRAVLQRAAETGVAAAGAARRTPTATAASGAAQTAKAAAQPRLRKK